MTNAMRAERAYRTVQKYVSYDSGEAYSNEDADTHLSDLLCDLMHFADEQGADFDAAMVRATMHHEAEVEEAILSATEAGR